jgi:hypothetical protein
MERTWVNWFTGALLVGALRWLCQRFLPAQGLPAALAVSMRQQLGGRLDGRQPRGTVGCRAYRVSEGERNDGGARQAVLLGDRPS